MKSTGARRQLHRVQGAATLGPAVLVCLASFDQGRGQVAHIDPYLATLAFVIPGLVTGWRSLVGVACMTVALVASSCLQVSHDPQIQVSVVDEWPFLLIWALFMGSTGAMAVAFGAGVRDIADGAVRARSTPVRS